MSYADEWYDEHEDEIREAVAIGDAFVRNGRLIWKDEDADE